MASSSDCLAHTSRKIVRRFGRQAFRARFVPAARVLNPALPTGASTEARKRRGLVPIFPGVTHSGNRAHIGQESLDNPGNRYRNRENRYGVTLCIVGISNHSGLLLIAMSREGDHYTKIVSWSPLSFFPRKVNSLTPWPLGGSVTERARWLRAARARRGVAGLVMFAACACARASCTPRAQASHAYAAQKAKRAAGLQTPSRRNAFENARAAGSEK